MVSFRANPLTLVRHAQSRKTETTGKCRYGIGRHVTELDRLRRDLSKVVRSQAIGRWLTEPNDAFDGNAPADLIAKGKVDLLWQMIFELRSGVSS